MNDVKPGWKTTEFWTLIFKIATSVVLLLVVLGKISSAQADTINQTIVQIGGAVLALLGVTMVNGIAARSYILARADVKNQAAAAKAQVDSAVKLAN